MIVEYDCIVCGTHCRKSRSPAGMKTPPKFCSQKCSGVHKSLNKKGPTQNFKGTCKQCGKEFTTYKSPSRDTPKYCSVKCTGSSQTGENNPAYNGGRYICNGYWVRFVPDHPNATAKGVMLEHRLVMEEKLGRYLTREEVVHHIDFDKLNNHPDNLMLFPDQGSHIRFHAKLRRGE